MTALKVQIYVTNSVIQLIHLRDIMEYNTPVCILKYTVVIINSNIMIYRLHVL